MLTSCTSCALTLSRTFHTSVWISCFDGTYSALRLLRCPADRHLLVPVPSSSDADVGCARTLALSVLGTAAMVAAIVMQRTSSGPRGRCVFCTDCFSDYRSPFHGMHSPAHSRALRFPQPSAPSSHTVWTVVLLYQNRSCIRQLTNEGHISLVVRVCAFGAYVFLGLWCVPLPVDLDAFADGWTLVYFCGGSVYAVA